MPACPASVPVTAQPKKYSSAVCSFIWPKHPGYTGGEIREYHLLRGLLANSRVTFLSLTSPAQDSRQDLSAQVEALYSPENVQKARLSLGTRLKHSGGKIHTLLHKYQIPAIGPRYHAECTYFSRQVELWILPTLRRIFQAQAPDFVFVSPQLNPLALQIDAVPARTRLIFATYDVEATRLARLEDTYQGLPRLAAHLETGRARHFERDNLRAYDGLIAVSDLDRETFVRDYDFPSERILVIENSVDTDYFAFHPRNDTGEKSVVFTANLGYRPNDDAAQRLLTNIMPLVRQKISHVKAWLVGQLPTPELLRLANEQNIVTGRVEDVRPYLQQASAACMPLRAGSGTKYKVLEALSTGVPVVCTSLAMEGQDLTPGTHLLRAETDEEIANALVNILAQPQNYHRMAELGRQQVEECYSWAHNLQKLPDWLDKIAQLPKRAQTESK